MGEGDWKCLLASVHEEVLVFPLQGEWVNSPGFAHGLLRRVIVHAALQSAQSSSRMNARVKYNNNDTPWRADHVEGLSFWRVVVRFGVRFSPGDVMFARSFGNNSGLRISFCFLGKERSCLNYQDNMWSGLFVSTIRNVIASEFVREKLSIALLFLS